ncbi:MAG TPA: 1,4-alpha-glucan branching enzyme, partial [Paracoccaceae bacterium]|nr:1,4-alpha-glucan branching enzyme [Paracoccaceae bacterium]
MANPKTFTPPFSNAVAEQVVTGGAYDAFGILGPHQAGRRWTVTTFVPGAERVEVLDAKKNTVEAELERVDGRGLFSGYVRKPVAVGHYRLRAHSGQDSWEFEDTYRFSPVLGEMDEYLIAEGAHLDLWKRLGAHVITHDGLEGTHFAVWAPSAARVSLVGDFNMWDGRRNVMRPRGTTGVWELFVPGLGDGTTYKYEILSHEGVVLPLKADPLGFGSEHPPATASVVRDLSNYSWGDGE